MQKFCNSDAFLLFTHPCYNSSRTRILLTINFTLLNTNLSGTTVIIINYMVIIDAILVVSIFLWICEGEDRYPLPPHNLSSTTRSWPQTCSNIHHACCQEYLEYVLKNSSSDRCPSQLLTVSVCQDTE